MTKPLPPKLDDAEVDRLLAARLPRWMREGDAIARTYRTGGFRASMLIANAVGHLSEAAWHHPDLHVSWPTVTVRLTTHDAGGITLRDIELAERIEGVVTWRPGGEAGVLEGVPAGERWAYLAD